MIKKMTKKMIKKMIKKKKKMKKKKMKNKKTKNKKTKNKKKKNQANLKKYMTLVYTIMTNINQQISEKNHTLVYQKKYPKTMA